MPGSDVKSNTETVNPGSTPFGFRVYYWADNVSNAAGGISTANVSKLTLSTMQTFNRIVIFALVVLGLVSLACAGPEPPAVTPALTIEQVSEQASTEAAPRDTPVAEPTPTIKANLAELLLIDRALQPGQASTEAVIEMGDSGNVGFAPLLVDLMRFSRSRETRSQLAEALVKLAGEGESVQPIHLNWDWWVVWLGENPQVKAVDGYDAWKGRLFERTDEDMGALLYRHIPTRIRLEEVVWGGVPKDGIPSLDNPPTLPADAAQYLNPNDRVFGVSFNGEHRAYPLRVMNPHEMTNDVVGGVPFALAY